MYATYLIDWRCEGCRQTGTHLLAMELTIPECHLVTYVGGAMPQRIVDLYDAELCNVEAEHAQATGCHGRICGEGGAIVRGKPLRQDDSDGVQALETRHRPAKSRWWNPASWLQGRSASRDGETGRIIATVSFRPLLVNDEHDGLEELFKWP